MKFKIGDKVRVKNDLVVDKIYYNEDSHIADVFTPSMIEYLGNVAVVENIHNGRYKLDISYHNFTCDMLELVEAVKSEADEIIEHMLRLIPQQLIDDALDKKDEERFNELIKVYGAEVV